MSTTLGIALCALISVVVLSLELGVTRGRVTDLEKKLKNEVEFSRNYNKYQERLINGLIKRVDQNVYNSRQLSESCSQIEDLDTAIKVNQKDIERALDMVEELKAKRSMDILDKLREED